MSITAWLNFLTMLTPKRSGRALALVLLFTPVIMMLACGGGAGSTTSTPSPLPVAVQITPGSSTVVVGQSQTFAGTVQNSSNPGISWSVQEGASGGSITAGGVYTAPMKAGSYHVVASSLADPTKTAAAAVTVTAPAPAIISTAPSLANEDDPYSYALAVTDPVNTAITLSLVSGPNGAQLSGSTLTWTPTHAQSRIANAFDIQATTSAGGSAHQKFSVTPLGTIRGTAVDTYVTAEGSVTGAEDLTKVYIGASVPNGNSWRTIEGVAHADGSFEIHGVPAGNYWFAAASGGYWTSASDIDLGQDFLGRPDGVLPSTPTYLALDFLGLASWETEDSIELFNPNLRQSFDWSDNNNPGDTSTASLWEWTGPLSDASRGDAWYATQVRSQEVGATSWRYLARATPALVITQSDGSSTDLSGTLSDAPKTTVHLKALGSQFAALAPAVGLNAQVHSTNIGIYLQPLTALKGEIGDAQTLLQRDGQEPVTADIDFGDVTFGNPFPSQWTPFVSLGYELTVPFTASGATSAIDVSAEIYLSTTQLPSLDKPFAPIITPVRNVKVNGSLLTQPRSLATLAPSLSWDPPATGAATGYRVTVYQLSKTGSASSYQALLDLFTKDTTMVIPDGVLLTGKEYFFGIRSYLAPGVDLTAAPYRAGFPWAHTDMLTAVVSTSGAAPGVNRAASSAMQHIVRGGMDTGSVRAGSVKRPGVRNLPHPTTSPISQ